jgi:hypothetical protein
MTLAGVSQTIRDPGLGLSGNVSMIPVILGKCSLGTDLDVKAFSNPVTLVTERGVGAAVEAAAFILNKIGGPVIVVNSPTSVAASNGSVTKSGGGPTVTIAGTALFDANIRIEIMLGGALGVGQFRYTLDDYVGATDSTRTWSATLTIPSGGTFAIPGLGITVTFPAGTYVLAETYSATVNCAAFNSTNLGAAMDALKASGLDWRFVYCVSTNNTGDEAAHATLIAALQSKLQSFTTTGDYKRGIISTSVEVANPIADIGDVVAVRVNPIYGLARVIGANPLVGFGTPVIPASSLVAFRAAGCGASTDLKRVKGDGYKDGGPLPDVLEIFQDEFKNELGLNAKKISSLRTYPKKTGFFVTEGFLKSADGSDFTKWHRGICMDIACEVSWTITTDWIGMGVRVNAEGEGGGAGTIDDRDAQRLEKEVQDALEQALLNPQNAEGTKGHVSRVQYKIDRTNNVLGTETILGTVGILPLGSVTWVHNTLQFTAKFASEAA